MHSQMKSIDQRRLQQCTQPGIFDVVQGVDPRILGRPRLDRVLVACHPVDHGGIAAPIAVPVNDRPGAAVSRMEQRE